MKKVLMIIAPQGYQDIEYETPKQLIQQANISVVTASLEKSECMGTLGGKTQATIALNDVQIADYDGIIFVGGPGAVIYQQNVEAKRIAQTAVQQRKILAAICIAPTILAMCAVLKNKQATVWNKDQKQAIVLQQYGAKYINENVICDGLIITANGPAAAADFARAIIKQLMKK